MISKHDVNSMANLLTMRTDVVINNVEKELQQLGYETHRSEDLYVFAKGDEGMNVCVVAHADTVKSPTNLKYDAKLGKFSSKTGLGADDRAGVFGLLELAREGARQGRRPCIILTNYEETGGTGARALAQNNVFRDYDIDFLIELDRAGNNDAVFYSCDNKEFKKYVESFGFNEEYGSFSDISILMPHTGACGANLSIGYFNEHTDRETLLMRSTRHSINKVKDILDDAYTRREKYSYVPDVFECYYDPFAAEYVNCDFGEFEFHGISMSDLVHLQTKYPHEFEDLMDEFPELEEKLIRRGFFDYEETIWREREHEYEEEYDDPEESAWKALMGWQEEKEARKSIKDLSKYVDLFDD